MSDILDRLRALNADFLHEEAAAEIERLRDIEAAYDLNQKNSYRAIMMWEKAHSKRASGIHEVELLTWLLDEVERLRAGAREMLEAVERAEAERDAAERHADALLRDCAELARSRDTAREVIKTAADVIENYDCEVITDTIWLSSNETLVDYLRSAGGQP